MSQLNLIVSDKELVAQDKVFSSKLKREEFLDNNHVIYQIPFITDSRECVQIYKIQNNGNVDDYILANNGRIIYKEEFEFLTDSIIRRESNSNQQYQLIFRHLSRLSKNNIPVGTLLNAIFLMNTELIKDRKHNLILLSYQECSDIKDVFGRVKANKGQVLTEKRQSYQSSLGFDSPTRLFDGNLSNIRSFEAGIISKDLKREFESRKYSINWGNDENLIEDIKEMLLQVTSKYNCSSSVIISNTDQEILINPDITNFSYIPSEDYLNIVNRIQSNLQLSISRRRGNLPKKLQELSQALKLLNDTSYKEISHNTLEINFKEAIQVAQKNLIIKSLRGNNGALILGKFRVITKGGHFRVINRAIREYDFVTVHVQGENKEKTELSVKMLKDTFGDSIEVITSNESILDIINSCSNNINQIIQGQSSQRQIARKLANDCPDMLGIQVQEYQTANNITQTDILQNIEDQAFFEKNTPIQVNKFYEEVKRLYS